MTRTASNGANIVRDLMGTLPEKAPITDPIAEKPGMSGLFGKAWTITDDNRLTGREHSLAHWLIEAPRAHPVWHSYSLVMHHLRPMKNLTKPMIYLPGATHEVCLFALDPMVDRRPLIAGGKVEALWLMPGNFAAQFIAATDAVARDRVRWAAQAVCDGVLNPDTDFRRQWVDLFGDNMMRD